MSSIHSSSAADSRDSIILSVTLLEPKESAGAVRSGSGRVLASAGVEVEVGCADVFEGGVTLMPLCIPDG